VDVSHRSNHIKSIFSILLFLLLSLFSYVFTFSFKQSTNIKDNMETCKHNIVGNDFIYDSKRTIKRVGYFLRTHKAVKMTKGLDEELQPVKAITTMKWLSRERYCRKP
jgi:hypothetical protein